MSDKYDELKKYVNIKEKDKEKEKENEKNNNNDDKDDDKDDRPNEEDCKQDENYEVSCVDLSHFRVRRFNEVRRIPLEPLDNEIMDDVM